MLIGLNSDVLSSRIFYWRNCCQRLTPDCILQWIFRLVQEGFYETEENIVH
jgi:hypothetical protein